jgi:hypothetical protein
MLGGGRRRRCGEAVVVVGLMDMGIGVEIIEFHRDMEC